MRYDAALRAVEREIADTMARSKSILASAESEGRSPSDEERAELDAQLHAVDVLKEKKAQIEADKALVERVDTLGASIRVEEPAPSAPARDLTAGEMFVKSDGYKQAAAGGFSGRWTTGEIEVKTTLFETASPAGGADLVQPEVRPGIQPILFQPLTIADLLSQGSTESNVVRYIKETTATNAADTVAEGGDKPESTLAFDNADVSVKKIATFLPVSDEMLEDASQIRSYIDSRLGFFVKQTEEDQLLNGAGAGNDIDGILHQVPTSAPDHAAIYSSLAGATAADHVYHGLALVERDSFLSPDAIVMNPVDWENMVLLKDGNDAYLGGGPFSAGAGRSMWGLPVVVTSAMTAGTALVGAFKAGAQMFRRGGLRVEASNSHSDYFTKNLVAIRAEERLALAIYRPSAFATVDLNGAAT